MLENYNLEFHHIGCLTSNIEKTKGVYASALGIAESSVVYNISSQKVKVCFLKNHSSTYIELVEPTDDASPLNRLLKTRNFFYHLGYLTTDFEKTIADLTQKEFILFTTFNSEAFANKLCAFLYSPEGHFIEIIQK